MKNKILFLCISFTLCSAFSAVSQIINTYAGTGSLIYGGDGGPATAAGLGSPHGICLDSLGNLYIAAGYIRKVTPSGIISSIAGIGIGGHTGDGGPATAAELEGPVAVAVDGGGNVYIADETVCIRKINALGIISTIAGGAHAGYSGDGGPATAALLNDPSGLAVDRAGNLYIADLSNNRIRKIDPSGIISTIAGTGTAGYSGDGVPATATELNAPADVAVDAGGNLYFIDEVNCRVRKIDPAGIISTIAGTGVRSYSGDGGPATAATLNLSTGIALDSCGNIYVADGYSSVVRKIDPAGIITTVAGTGAYAYSGDGGPATAAALNEPVGVAVSAGGNVFISDFAEQRIRLITAPVPFVAAIAGAATVCVGALTTLADTSAGGVWSSADATVAAIGSTGMVTGVAAGAATISYAVTNGWCATAFATSTLTVNPRPSAGAITGADSVCATFTVTLADAAAGGTWGSSNATATVAGGVVSGITPGTDTIFYMVTNVCGTDTAREAITIHNCAEGTKAPAASSMVLYPNPNNGTFTINLSADKTQQAHIIITNSVGEKVKEINTLTNKALTISLAGPAGIYFLSLATGDSVYNTKILKE